MTATMEQRTRGCDEYFGLCPKCNQPWHEYRNVHKAHWFVCHECKTRWHGGSNLFSSWRHEDEATWDRNIELLRTYQDVEPIIKGPEHWERLQREHQARLADGDDPTT